MTSPVALTSRSRSGSTASQKYVPPAQRSRQTSTESGGQRRDSNDQVRFKQWLNWDSSELEKRQRGLIGKTVVGKLSPKRGDRYFVKWNINTNDTIVLAADKVEEVLGDTPPPGMWVSCTVVGLGPRHVQWNKQHPYAMTLESRETRPSHQPSKGALPKSSPYWKNSQRVGLTKPVVSKHPLRQTVPAEFSMSPVRPPKIHMSPPRNERAVPTTPLPPPNLLPKGVILPQTVEQPTGPPVSLAKRTNGANINLVTGEVRSRGRADSAGTWRRVDRSFTV